jgi:putative molybdopterin biosynthesis protein
MRNLDEVRRALVVTGSHDPLIDEVAELMRRRWPDAVVSSTHVGSMGALLAAGRREMHVGGIHLLDTETGTYNVSFLRKHVPQGGVRLVECVQRVQGLMVAPGNPLGIEGIADLAREGMRYVNRQKGSGTRVLCDHLVAQQGLDPRAIYGYSREEFTHTAVAALVAAGSADAGMGIFSAAQLYDLDFVPLCLEQYDLLIPDYAWNLPAVQQMIEVLGSSEFRTRLDELGGYEIEHPGTVRLHLQPTDKPAE